MTWVYFRKQRHLVILTRREIEKGVKLKNMSVSRTQKRGHSLSVGQDASKDKCRFQEAQAFANLATSSYTEKHIVSVRLLTTSLLPGPPLSLSHTQPVKEYQLTSKSQSSILPNTSCFPNLSVVTLGLEIPNATRARNLASSLTSVAASMALTFFSSMRPFLERWSRAWRNLTGVFERQKLQ